jgi:hypothetical protein
MRLIRIEWGKFKLELPGEIFIFLLLKAFLVLHFLNV